MVETTKLEFSTSELKLLLTAFDIFNKRLENKKTRIQTLLQIHESEKFFNFDFDVKLLIDDLPQFLNAMGFLGDKLYDAFSELAHADGTIKPLPLEDDRYTLEDVIPFLDIELKKPLEA